MAKHDKNSSIFQLIDRKFFNELTLKWDMDKGVRTFGTWEMACALISSTLMRLTSYREIEEGLGIPRSTMGDALTTRSYGFFDELTAHLLLQLRAKNIDRKTANEKNGNKS